MSRRKREPTLTDELSEIAEKHRKVLAPLADREEKLVAELQHVRERRIAVEACLRPLERMIAEQRACAEAAATGGFSSVIATEMSTSKVGEVKNGLGA